MASGDAPAAAAGHWVAGGHMHHSVSARPKVRPCIEEVHARPLKTAVTGLSCHQHPPTLKEESEFSEERVAQPCSETSLPCHELCIRALQPNELCHHVIVHASRLHAGARVP